MKRLILLIILFVCSGFYIQADAQNRLSREEFRTKKKSYLTEQAGLTEAEATRFFPLYFEMRGEIKQLNADTDKRENELKKGKHTEDEYAQVLDKIYETRAEVVKVEKQYFTKFKSFLSNEKLYKIYRAEINFHRHILKKMVH